MRIYLDTCCFHRPLDDQRQLRVAMETEVILTIIELCEDGSHSLISSEVIEFENGQCKDPARRALANDLP